ETPDICKEGARALAMDLYDVAKARLNACLALESLTAVQRAAALRERGDAHFAEDAAAPAIADYEEAVRLGGPDLDILIALGRAHHHNDSYDAALMAFDRAIALDEDSAEVPYFRGLVLYDLGRY